jgi:hypothetical protein
MNQKLKSQILLCTLYSIRKSLNIPLPLQLNIVVIGPFALIKAKTINSSFILISAPEILRNETGNQASDMWSIGAFAYLL